MDKPSYVYILASRPYGTLYVGVTSDLIKRIWQHREAAVASFTKKHSVNRLVWYEIHTDIAQPSHAKNVSNPGTATGKST